jgi:hypothetical protein
MPWCRFPCHVFYSVLCCVIVCVVVCVVACVVVCVVACVVAELLSVGSRRNQPRPTPRKPKQSSALSAEKPNQSAAPSCAVGMTVLVGASATREVAMPCAAVLNTCLTVCVVVCVFVVFVVVYCCCVFLLCVLVMCVGSRSNHPRSPPRSRINQPRPPAPSA